jgi:hypothetical protein
MSKSTPADLAVAFRSMDRRRREAIDAADGAAVTDLLAAHDREIAAAATIERTPSDDWDEAILDLLRQHASDAGIALRRVVEAAPPADD